jgi:hypothetical protein
MTSTSKTTHQKDSIEEDQPTPSQAISGRNSSKVTHPKKASPKAKRLNRPPGNVSDGSRSSKVDLSDGSRSSKVDLSDVDRKKLRSAYGAEVQEKIKIHDEIKHSKELWAYSSSSGRNKTIRCYWDHHTFDNPPVYCPIFYRQRQVAKTNQVEFKTKNDVTTSVYVIKENIPESKDISHLKNVSEVTNAYYEVDCIFCSPQCCLAFIRHARNAAGGSKYEDSERLLHAMLNITSPITPANDYRLLEAYGGNLTIDQFRSNNLTYKHCGTTVLISHLFEKKINLSMD